MAHQAEVSARPVQPRHGIFQRRVATPDGTFRPELHGLRGLALTLVVLFHLFGNGRVSGGIDVFLAISGFLFTGSLLRRALRDDGRISYIDHIGRLGKRLLPPIIPVLIAVAMGAYLFLPVSRWTQVAQEIKATVLYYENWELISSQLDYNAAGAETSPLQHFWSLSVQGQFYLVAPLVVMVVVFIANRKRIPARSLLLGVLAAVTVVSLAFSQYLVAVDQPVAYFHTGARIWEFTLGGVAALLLPKISLDRRERAVIGWVGVAMIVSCGFLFDGGATFPGVWALWPVLGMIFVLAGGVSQSPLGVDRLLLTRPFNFLADISYSLYLWHWPVLIFFLAAFGRDQVGPRSATAILLLSILLAWLSQRIVEDGLTNHRLFLGRRRQFVSAVATVTVVAVVTTGSALQLEERQEQLLADALTTGEDHVGAAALYASQDLDLSLQASEAVTPALSVLGEDRPAIYQEECTEPWRDEHTELLTCEYRPENAKRRVVMTGGSHVGQWWPAMKAIAQEHSWNLVLMEKGACHLTTDQKNVDDLGFVDACRDWNVSAFDQLTSDPPDAVFTLGSTTRGGAEEVPSGMQGALTTLTGAGILVVAIRDTPRLTESAEECLTRLGLDPKACGQPRLESLNSEYPLLEALPEGAVPIDMTSAYCTEEFCPAIVGGRIVMRDKDHVSATYIASITPFLEMELKKNAPELFE